MARSIFLSVNGFITSSVAALQLEETGKYFRKCAREVKNKTNVRRTGERRCKWYVLRSFSLLRLK